jgi:hypothetical protein
MKNFNVSAIFTAVDKISAPVKRIESSLKSMADKVGSFSQKAHSSFGKIDNAVNKTGHSIDRLKARFNFSNVIGKIRDVGRALSDMGGKAKSTFSALTPGWGTAGVLALGGYAAKSILDIAGEREGYALALSTMYGGDKQGAARLSTLEKTATKLPYNLQNYVEADTVMKDVGLTATPEMFKGLASLAAAKHIEFPDFVRDMRSMETESLKTILGTAAMPEEKDGIVSFIGWNGKREKFKKDEKGLQKFYKYLANLGNTKYEGLADKMGNSYLGAKATLSDTIDATLAKAVTDSGWLKSVTDMVQGISKKTDSLTPKMTAFFTSLHKKIVGTGLLEKIGSVGGKTFEHILDTVDHFVSNLDGKGVEDFARSIEDLPNKLTRLVDSLIKLGDSAEKLANHPWQVLFGSPTQNQNMNTFQGIPTQTLVNQHSPQKDVKVAVQIHQDIHQTPSGQIKAVTNVKTGRSKTGTPARVATQGAW